VFYDLLYHIFAQITTIAIFLSKCWHLLEYNDLRYFILRYGKYNKTGCAVRHLPTAQPVLLF